MAQNISGLFNYDSPEAIQTNYLNTLAARRPRGGGDLYSQLANAGGNIGGLLGYTLGGLAGYKPAGMQKAETMDQIMAEAAKGDNPLAQAKKAYELFAANGMGREAQVAMERMTELKKAEEAQGFNKYMSNPKTAFETPQDYFAASRAAFAAGKDGTPLLNAGKALAKEQAVKTKRAALVKSRIAGIKRNNKEMPEEVVSLVAEDDDIYQKWGATLFEAKKNNYDLSYQTFDDERVMRLVDKDTGKLIKEVVLGKAATGAKVEVNTGDMETAAQKAKGKGIGEDIAADLSATRKAAQTANENLPKMYTALNILETQPITTGLGSAFYDILNQVRAQYLSDKEAGNIVQNDQYLDSLVGGDVFNAIADLGIGARGIDTPKEKDFLLEVVTGKRSLSKGALIEITKMRIENTEKSVNKFNDYLSKGDYADYEKALGRKLSPIQLRSANQAPTSSNWRE
jgi:hypothetical protein